MIAAFAKSVKRCVVIEEGDPYLVEAIRAAGIKVDGKAEMYRFGELDVPRVRRILERRLQPRTGAAAGQTAAIVRRVPVSPGVRSVAPARLHRGGRHWLLYAWAC